MRLFLTSLLAGGCLLAGVSAASAEEVRLDDTALDQVSAGLSLPDPTANLLGVGIVLWVEAMNNEYVNEPNATGNILTNPITGPIFLPLYEFGQSLLLPPA